MLIALFIAAVSAGIALLVTKNGPGSPGIEIMLPTSTPSPELKVYISGAVGAPGVFIMEQGDRVIDAMALAGGATAGSRLSCINLAVRVEDEAHYNVPGAGEDCQAATSAADAHSEDTRIDLNTATLTSLETLPGIGEVKARAIVEYRESNGLFQATEDILEVNGIGPKIYESIRELVRVSGSAP